MEKINQLLAASPEIRYAAIYEDEVLVSDTKSYVENGSSVESDRYEELIVNPTLLTLLTQRGNIDCGGLSYVLVRYGQFFQLIQPTENGHISIAIDKNADTGKIQKAVDWIVKSWKK